MAKRKRYGVLVLSTNQEIIPDRNAIDAHEQALMGKYRVAATHPESFRTVHSLATFFSKCVMFESV
jgi:hypothetical protein